MSTPDYYLAIGGSAHGRLLEHIGHSNAVLIAVPLAAGGIPLVEEEIWKTSSVRVEEYRLQHFRISKGTRRWVTYFVLESLPISGALALINDLEGESEPLPFQR